MKNLKNLGLVLCTGLLVFATSCDETTSDSVTLLAKIIWEYDNGAGEETTLEYDNQNRLVKIKETDIDDGKLHEYQITYSSDGKISQELDLENGVETDKTTYTWTATNITEVYAVKVNNVWVEDDYKYVYDLNSDGQITKKQGYYKQNNVWVEVNYDLNTWTDENIVQLEKWGIYTWKNDHLKHLFAQRFRFSNSSGLKTAYDTLLSTYNFTYDNKKNAFAVFGFVFGIPEGFNRNNITEYKWSHIGFDDEISTYTYEYNSDSYPTKSTATYSDRGTIETEVTLFEYITK